MNLLDAFLETLYPPRCIVCDEPIPHYGYCLRCKGKVKTIKEEMCLFCGARMKLCECNKRIYHFDAITAPYFNEGYPKQAVYDLKFNRKFNCVKNFGRQMAKKVAANFGVENIDCICCVPPSKESLYTRDFNQSDLFAREVAKCLQIEYKPKLLIKKDSVRSQHRIRTVQDRFDNVRNGYYSKEKIKGKNVLIVDDIKTTGATIDECARQLKFAGAEKVYCVVALITENKYKDESYGL